MRTVFLGPPGAGKGTQAERLAGSRGVPHVATGNILREATVQGTPVGLLAKGYMDKGELVPDDVVIVLVRDRLSRPDCAEGFVLDGFPRTRAQAQALDRALEEVGADLDRVVYLEVPIEEVVKRNTRRLVCRTCSRPYNLDAMPPRVEGRCDVDGGELYVRSDDQEETVIRRTGVYKNETAALRHYYAAQGKLRKVVATGSIDEVSQAVQAAVS